MNDNYYSQEIVLNESHHNFTTDVCHQVQLRHLLGRNVQLISVCLKGN